MPRCQSRSHPRFSAIRTVCHAAQTAVVDRMRSAGQRVLRVKDLLREHRHVIIVITLLTLFVTFPAILYVFRTDVFWLPSGHYDIYIEIWDIWYSRQFSDRSSGSSIYELDVLSQRRFARLPSLSLFQMSS